MVNILIGMLIMYIITGLIFILNCHKTDGDILKILCYGYCWYGILFYDIVRAIRKKKQKNIDNE